MEQLCFFDNKLKKNQKTFPHFFCLFLCNQTGNIKFCFEQKFWQVSWKLHYDVWDDFWQKKSWLQIMSNLPNPENSQNLNNVLLFSAVTSRKFESIFTQKFSQMVFTKFEFSAQLLSNTWHFDKNALRKITSDILGKNSNFCPQSTSKFGLKSLIYLEP